LQEVQHQERGGLGIDVDRLQLRRGRRLDARPFVDDGLRRCGRGGRDDDGKGGERSQSTILHDVLPIRISASKRATSGNVKRDVKPSRARAARLSGLAVGRRYTSGWLGPILRQSRCRPWAAADGCVEKNMETMTTALDRNPPTFAARPLSPALGAE